MDEPQSLGDVGIAPNPMEYALASLGSCQAITYRFSAEKLGLAFDRVSVNVDAGRGGDLRTRIEERYDKLQRTVDAHRPALDNFSNPVPVKTTLALIE